MVFGQDINLSKSCFGLPFLGKDKDGENKTSGIYCRKHLLVLLSQHSLSFLLITGPQCSFGDQPLPTLCPEVDTKPRPDQSINRCSHRLVSRPSPWRSDRPPAWSKRKEGLHFFLLVECKPWVDGGAYHSRMKGSRGGDKWGNTESCWECWCSCMRLSWKLWKGMSPPPFLSPLPLCASPHSCPLFFTPIWIGFLFHWQLKGLWMKYLHI